MYTRGQFAIVGKVGRKALRIWDEEGLLSPSYVNEENGYNYYDESQLITLEKIKRLRKIGLSIYEIKQIFDGKCSEKELIDSKLREMDLNLQEIRSLAVSDDKEKEAGPGATPDICSFERCRCLYVDENVDLENLGISVGKLYEKASIRGIKPSGSHFVIYKNLSDEEGLSMRTCLPVGDHMGEDTIEVFEEKCLHLRFTEGFSKVARAHILIKEYTDENRISCADRVYEVYNKDMSVDVYHALA
ncbi:MAG: MerR family transcriptional regulator [Lachnospiraceae bacterium]|nr:MerR family transcriptional regulator [Lachnospiraceae bacterium]